jgi:hypothetical protein
MKVVALATLMAAVALLAPAAASADVTITWTCSSGGVTGSCSTGWYTKQVVVTFSVSGSNISNANCGPYTISNDTAGQTVACTVTLTDGTITGRSVTIKLDTTTPTVTALNFARGPDSNGWYNHPVQITATGTGSVSGVTCASVTFSGPDSGSASANATCTSGAGLVSAPKSISFQYDATAPSVTPSPARGADANGWYNRAVAVSFAGNDGVSGVASCTSATYSGPDSDSASVSGSCTDKAGNTGSASFGLKYDATPPAVTGETPDRAPDANDYYNHKLTVTFAGSDATSGIASCDTPSYDKPNDATAAVTGRCTDNAGNQSSPATFSFKYDSSPPKLSGLQVTSLDKAATLSWQASADVAKVTVTRTGGGKPDTVYSGKRVTTVTDKKVRNGDRYTYVVTAYDEAGNSVVLKGLATPSAPLLAPRAAAHVRGGVTLRWRPIRGATYYNVQLWLKGRKVLSTWPAGATLHIDRLAPGTYTWLVWPGKGARSSHRYGPKVGSSTFVVTG